MSTKYKKQYRLFDIYRYISTGEKSKIMGISDYTARDGIIQTVCVDTTDFVTDVSDIDGTISEDAVRAHIKIVNAHLRNCKRPGPKARYIK